MSVNTDFERLMLDKKLEVLKEINDTKIKILKELYAVNTRIHTCYHDYVNDYNQIRYLLEQELVRIQNEHEKFKEEMRSLYGEFVANIDEYIYRIFAPEFDKLNGLTDAINQAISKVNEALAKVADLEERMLTDEDVDNIVNQVVGSLDGFVTDETFNEFVTNISNLINESLVNPDWNEGDTTKKSHVLNRTHYGNFAYNEIYNDKILNVHYSTPIFQKVKNHYLKIPVEIKHVSKLKITIYGNGNKVADEGLNGEYIISPSRKDILILDSVNKGSGFVSVLKSLYNIVTWGNTEMNVAHFGVSETECPVFAYYYESNLYIVLNLKYVNYGEDYYNYINIKIEAEVCDEVKQLDYFYMGSDSIEGGVLTQLKNEQKWITPPLSEYEGYGIDYLYEENSHRIVEDGKAYFPISKIELENGLYIVQIDEYDCLVSYSEGLFEMVSDGIQNMFIRDEQIFIQLSHNFKSLLTDQYNAIIKVKAFRNYKKLNKLDAKFIGENPSNNNYLMYNDGILKWSELTLISPNGTPYTLTVDDNGTLSATPITT